MGVSCAAGQEATYGRFVSETDPEAKGQGCDAGDLQEEGDCRRFWFLVLPNSLRITSLRRTVSGFGSESVGNCFFKLTHYPGSFLRFFGACGIGRLWETGNSDFERQHAPFGM
jgi:hypothetical protein